MCTMYMYIILLRKLKVGRGTYMYMDMITFVTILISSNW